MAGIHDGEHGSQDSHRTRGTGAAELRESPRMGGAASRARLSERCLMLMMLMCQGRPRAREVGVSEGSGGES